MSKFRARQLDASKPVPIYMQHEVSDYVELLHATNRSVPQLPTGMEKEEETEHHLQQAIYHQRVIPVPEVYELDFVKDKEVYEILYPPTYKISRQYIHIHPFSADHDNPEYGYDSEDELWMKEHEAKGEVPIDPIQFEEMMDRLEKASGLKAITLPEAKVLLKDDDDLITAVYDYWLNKRLRLQHPLLLQVKTERGINTAANDPYIAFRKRTEKMQTRKNRKNDEISYEKMIRLRRDLLKALNLLELIRKREREKRELLQLNVKILEKRYEIQDFSGSILNELSQRTIHRSVFTPLVANQDQSLPAAGSRSWIKDDGKKERRPYKKRRRHQQSSVTNSVSQSVSYSHISDTYSSGNLYQQDSLSSTPREAVTPSPLPSEAEEDSEPDGPFTFRRKKNCEYYAPKECILSWSSLAEGVGDDLKHNFSLTSISHPTRRYVGFARRRLGRGGRPHFIPSSPTDPKASLEAEGGEIPFTLTSEVSTTSEPSYFSITAEVVEGPAKGATTQLEVSLPSSELDSLGEVILGDNLEVAIVGTDLCERQEPNCNVATEDLDPIFGELGLCGEMAKSSSNNKQHSINFSTQPSSKFITLDSAMLPLSVSGLQISSSSSSSLSDNSIGSGSGPGPPNHKHARGSLTPTLSPVTSPLKSRNLHKNRTTRTCESEGSENGHVVSKETSVLSSNKGCVVVNSLVSPKVFISRTNNRIANNSYKNNILTNGPSNSVDNKVCL